MKLYYLLILLLLTGCAHNIPGGEYVIHVPAMDVIITDKHFPVGLFGVAHREWKDEKWEYTIFIRGNQTDKGIDMSNCILGHEARHLLHWLDPAIKDPHEDLLYKLFRGWYK